MLVENWLVTLNWSSEKIQMYLIGVNLSLDPIVVVREAIAPKELALAILVAARELALKGNSSKRTSLQPF